MQVPDNSVLIKSDSISVELSLSNSAPLELVKILSGCLESSVRLMRSSGRSFAEEADFSGRVSSLSTPGQSSGAPQGWIGSTDTSVNGMVSAASSPYTVTTLSEPTKGRPREKPRLQKEKEKKEELEKTTSELRDVRLSALGVLNKAEEMYSELAVL